MTHVRLDVYPDGGLARLRINGEVDDAALHAAVVRWLDLLPEDHARCRSSPPVGAVRRGGRGAGRQAAVRRGRAPDEVVTTLLDS